MDNKILITVGRQIGAGGLDTARALSKKLDIPVYDKELLTIASLESGINQEFFEHKDEKPVSSSSFARFFDTQNYVPETAISQDKLFSTQSEVILKAAQSGSGIFVGRCADYIIRDFPKVLRVFITADMPDRVARLSKSWTMSEDDIRKMIEREDKKRAAYYNYYTFKKWGDSSSYDLCLNSSKFGIDNCVDTIINMLNNL
ncbi:MAG: cytidylate kinase-like family protein [Bacteroidales bacterium]|jgi:CMP/dCMP kinase|nr:cytidylate kinase-like family protein [Bacteroidales bacterium]